MQDSSHFIRLIKRWCASLEILTSIIFFKAFASVLNFIYFEKTNRFNQCCGSGMFIPDPGSDFFPSRIPDPNCLPPGSRIRIKEFKYFNPKKTKKWFLSSRKYDRGCSSRIPDPDADFLPIPDPDPGVKKGTGSRIRIRNTGSTPNYQPSVDDRRSVK